MGAKRPHQPSIIQPGAVLDASRRFLEERRQARGVPRRTPEVQTEKEEEEAVPPISESDRELDKTERAEARGERQKDRAEEALRRSLDDLTGALAYLASSLSDVNNRVYKRYGMKPHEFIDAVVIGNERWGTLTAFSSHKRALWKVGVWPVQDRHLAERIRTLANERIPKFITALRRLRINLLKPRSNISAESVVGRQETATRVRRMFKRLEDIRDRLRALNYDGYMRHVRGAFASSTEEKEPDVFRFVLSKRLLDQDDVWIPLHLPSGVRLKFPWRDVSKTIVLKSGRSKRDLSVREVRAYRDQVLPEKYLYSFVEDGEGRFIRSDEPIQVDDEYKFQHPIFPGEVFYVSTSHGFDPQLPSNRVKIITDERDVIRRIEDGVGQSLVWYPLLSDFRGKRIGAIVLRERGLSLRWNTLKGVLEGIPLKLDHKRGGRRERGRAARPHKDQRT